MCGSKCLQSILLVMVLILAKQTPARAQQARAIGLKGPVHTVLTEDFRSEGGVRSEPIGSVLEIYDRQGYQLEVYRYKPNGSLWVHTVTDRMGPQIQRMQITGTAPFESKTVQNVFDVDGHVIETDTYDANGVLISKSTFEIVQKQANSSTYRHIERSADGTENTVEVTETTDPQTGIEHQVQTRSGNPETDWVIQQNGDGTKKDKIVYADGSYNERERRSDGTTVEDK